MLLTRTVICSLKMGRLPHRPPRRCRSGGGRAWGGPGSEPPLSPSRLALVTQPLTPQVTPGMPGTAWGPVVRQPRPAPFLLRDRALWPSNRCTQLHLASSPCANHGPSRGITVVKTRRPSPPVATSPTPPPARVPFPCPWSSSDLGVWGRSLPCPPTSARAGLVHQGTGARAWGQVPAGPIQSPHP